MPSLDDVFNELLEKIRDPQTLNPARGDPIFYFTYPPERMLEIKKRLPRWSALLRKIGLEVRRVSLAELLWNTIDESGRWETWLELENDADIDQINEAVRDVLRRGDSFVKKVVQRIRAAPQGSVVFLSDAELLHPYFRTRTIESALHDKVTVPTVILYPGRRAGQYGLHFLDFYPVDGNYRSTLLGGP